MIVKTKIQALEKERTEFLVRGNTTSENIELFHGDCRAIFPTIAERLKKQGVISKVLIITDPPYNIKFQKYNDYNDNLPDVDYIKMMSMFKGYASAIIQYPEEMQSLIYPAIGKPIKSLCWCYNSNISKAFRLINIYHAKPDFKRVTQPYKNPTDSRVIRRIQHGSSGSSIYDWFSDIQLEKNVSKDKSSHPCQFPVALIERLILLINGLNKNTIIIDPFMGVGSTGIACKRMGLKFIGIEISKKYFDLAQQRICKK